MPRDAVPTPPKASGYVESCFAGLLPALAGQFEVIAVELPGHGRTRHIDRRLSYEDMAAEYGGTDGPSAA